MSEKTTFGLNQGRDIWITPATVLLLAANSLPLAGILWWDWNVFPLLLLFWCENALIGFFCVLRLLLTRCYCASTWVCKVFALPLFCFHYGIFLMVHGVFVIQLFGPKSVTGSLWPDTTVFYRLIAKHHLEWPLLALALSHAFSFFYHFVGKGEYHRVELGKIMVQPYRRVVVLHLALLAGGFGASLLGSPVWSLLLLLAGKCWLDWTAHVQEHRRLQNQTAASPLAVAPSS